MLAILRTRLGNNHDDELRNAAAEQAKITALRLNKLIEASLRRIRLGFAQKCILRVVSCNFVALDHGRLKLRSTN